MDGGVGGDVRGGSPLPVLAVDLDFLSPPLSSPLFSTSSTSPVVPSAPFTIFPLFSAMLSCERRFLPMSSLFAPITLVPPWATSPSFRCTQTLGAPH